MDMSSTTNVLACAVGYKQQEEIRAVLGYKQQEEISAQLERLHKSNNI